MASITDKHGPPIAEPDLLRDTISTVFPQVPSETNLPTGQVDSDEIPEVTTEEFLDAAKKIAENKTPSLNASQIRHC